ncbi:unnamed protein product [Rhizophagus irregularis]|nr:unnamed protein product [Rhizophagus irregularis]
MNCNASVDYAKLEIQTSLLNAHIMENVKYYVTSYYRTSVDSFLGTEELNIFTGFDFLRVRKYFSKNFGPTLRSRTILSRKATRIQYRASINSGKPNVSNSRSSPNACGHECLNECHECQKLSSQRSGDTNVPIERAHHGKYSKLPETRRAVAINAKIDQITRLNKSGHCSKDHPYIIESSINWIGSEFVMY